MMEKMEEYTSDTKNRSLVIKARVNIHDVLRQGRL